MKKFKKINLYIRVAIVYCIFLFIKWVIYESTGIEVGKEGMAAADILAANIQKDSQKMASLCKEKVTSALNKQSLKLKEMFKKQYNKNGQLKSGQLGGNIKCPKCPTCPKCEACKKYTAILREVN